MVGRRALLGLLTSRAFHSPPPLSFLPAHCSRSCPPGLYPNGASSRLLRLFTTIAHNISISDNCVKRLHEIIKEEGSTAEEKMLRVSVESGGCSGFQYLFTLENKCCNTDRVFEKDGVKVIVDDLSMDFLKGATIDYVDELIRSAFMVTQNPNSSSGCGCGSSFNVK